jgi:uronate dehydrogenase
MAVVLVTGASGSIGRMLRQRLVRHELRLTDVRADAIDMGRTSPACRPLGAA